MTRLRHPNVLLHPSPPAPVPDNDAMPIDVSMQSVLTKKAKLFRSEL